MGTTMMMMPSSSSNTTTAASMTAGTEVITDPSSFLTLEQKHLAVHLRLRPSETSTLEIVNATSVRAHPPKQNGTIKDYTFTSILDTNTSQHDVYYRTAAPLVRGLFAAENASENSNNNKLGNSALLFCYGMTNAGKTFTISGDLNHESKWGVLPRALQDIFHRASALQLDLQLAYMEIYNEQVYDLLQPQDKFTRTCPQLKVGENQNGMAVCKGLVQVNVQSVQHGLELVSAAKTKRQTSSNNLNAGSSRSHCICQLSVTSSDTQQQVNMWIVDLAGSERSKRTDAGQARLKEASQINKSLMTLMRCLMALREDATNKNNKERPPYRDSKITHLLMNHLTGPSAGRTTMIVNVHPADCDFDETQHVLQYAAQAKHVVVQNTLVGNNDKQKHAVQYGENGRKIVPQGKVAKLLAKLSPMLSPRARKRKGTENNKNAQAKKAKPAALVAAATVKEATSAAPTTTTTVAAGDASKELRRLKMHLSVTQVENEALKRENKQLAEENETLKDQLEALEDNVRAEVVEEMEYKQTEMIEKYESIIDGLKFNLRQNSHIASTTKSTRKKQMERVEEEIEELQEHVAECEREMARMRVEHETEIKTLRINYESQIDTLKAEIKALTETKHKLLDRMKGSLITLTGQGNVIDTEGIKDEATLRSELEKARIQIAVLERSKKEMAENYEQLLANGDDNDDDSEGFDDDEEDDRQSEENEVDSDDDVEAEGEDVLAHDEEESSDDDDSVAESKDAGNEDVDANELDTKDDASLDDSLDGAKNILLSSQTESDSSSGTHRAPLSHIAVNNSRRSDADEFGPDQWLFPKKNPKLDKSNGEFQRPKGRMPKGAEAWDSRKGAWRLSIV